MKIMARIEKIDGEQYLLEGEVFDSFLSARREMTQRMRARRAERQTNAAWYGRKQPVAGASFGPYD